MTQDVSIDDDLGRVDWAAAKAALAADRFDNGRTPDALRRSFESSAHVALAWSGDDLVGMSRLLSDGVCNAYLVDVWTESRHRHRGIGTAMVEHLVSLVPGQHVGLQTDDAGPFYEQMGFVPQPAFWSVVSGRWLDNDANR
jgi:GNAT superfamily N-acetyltransferase